MERRNPALTATGLAVWGLVIRLVIAAALFVGPKIVDTVTPLVEKGPIVQGVLADPTPVGSTTVGKVATAASKNPEVIAKLQQIQARDGALLKALQANPAIAQALATGGTPTAAQLATLGPDAVKQLQQPTTTADLTYVAVTAPAALGAPEFQAISAPTPPLAAALGTLQAEGPAVAQAAKDSPDQWKTYFLIGAAGELAFIPLIFLMAGYWDPRKAKAAAAAHEALIQREMAELEKRQGRPATA